VAPALAFAPFGIPAITFWIYVSASLVFIIGLIKIFGELPEVHGIDKIMPFGRLFFAIPLAVFGSEHFTATANVASLVPRWIPAHTFWVYLVGLAFLCAALSIPVLVQARLAAALVGMTMLIFVLVMDIPGVVAQPGNRFFWALALRQLAFSGGAFAFAMSPWSTRSRQPSRTQSTAALAAIPRFFVGIPSLFYGVEHLLHPEYVPGVPLQKLTPDWIPGRILLSYFVGVILIVAGVCLLVNKKTHGSNIFRPHDSPHGVVDLPADAPRSANRGGCAEFFFRHAAFLRSHPAVGKPDGQGGRLSGMFKI